MIFIVTMKKDIIIDQLHKVKQAGKPVIGCFPLYPPLELLHAMGFTPVVLWGLKAFARETPQSDRHLQPYVCSVARHLTEFLLSEGRALIDGILMYNACDTLRNLPEIIAREFSVSGQMFPVIRMHIPMAPQQQTDSIGYFENEILSMIRSLQEHFRATLPAGAFEFSLGLYNQMRNRALEAEQRVADGRLRFLDFVRVMQAGWLSTVEDHLAALEALLDTDADRPGNGFGSEVGPGIIVSGILPPPESIILAMESVGLRVVGNDIASLRRSYGDLHDSPADPAGYYKQFYFAHYPCPTLLYRGDSRFEALMSLIGQSNARGVIFFGEKFCEYEYFEFPYLERRLKENGILSLMIEMSIDDTSHTSTHIARIEAFSEMIRK
jgi:benzoyl-CoA reductase/2-hydroxyglutaryl-CoA dehydratase subunit BcrC/BadD/HgdB